MKPNIVYSLSNKFVDLDEFQRQRFHESDIDVDRNRDASAINAGFDIASNIYSVRDLRSRFKEHATAWSQDVDIEYQALAGVDDPKWKNDLQPIILRLSTIGRKVTFLIGNMTFQHKMISPAISSRPNWDSRISS